MTHWNERYQCGEHAHDDPHPLVTRFASTLPPGRALDVACGVGRHSLWLAQLGWTVSAVDYSSTAIESLRERAEKAYVTVHSRIADLEQNEFLIEPAAFDLVVVCNYLQRSLFLSSKEGTRIGGIVIAIIAL